MTDHHSRRQNQPHNIALHSAIEATKSSTGPLNSRLENGKDLSVCVVDAEGLEHHLVPSLTSYKRPESVPRIKEVIKWFAQGASSELWKAPLLVEPKKLVLFKGESTSRPE